MPKTDDKKCFKKSAATVMVSLYYLLEDPIKKIKKVTKRLLKK